MKTESGDQTCPIWLLINPSHPLDIPNIWNPIMYEIQDRVYRKLHARINSKNIFIKNVVSHIGRVPDPSFEVEAEKSIVMLRKRVLEFRPKLVITFGSIAFEYVGRVLRARAENEPKYWYTSNLGNEFERSIANFDITRTNWIPLARRRTNLSMDIKDWEDSNIYYHTAVVKIADTIIEHKDSLKIWI